MHRRKYEFVTRRKMVEEINHVVITGYIDPLVSISLLNAGKFVRLSHHADKRHILAIEWPLKGESRKRTMAYLARVSTPRCVQFISARICSSSRFSRETRLLASATSDFKRSGSYLVLNELELEHTVGKNVPSLFLHLIFV